MDLVGLGTRLFGRMDPRLAAVAERFLTRLPPVRARLEREYARLLAGMDDRLRPYRGGRPAFRRLPEEGLPRAEVLRGIEELAAGEEGRWREGRVSGAVYHGDRAHVNFLNRVYALTSQVNPLHADVWPSAARYEAEVVAMTASMLGAEGATHEICGTVTSGGTESIFMAVKAYRDRARARGLRRPQIVAPVTAHPAFDKAAHALGMKIVRVRVGADFRADAEAMARAIGRDTALVVGSAPTFPHGVVDPIPDLSELARARDVGFHTDACMGGFILPWARRLGYDVPRFDFSLPGVTSLSADTHKFGFAPKGTSVVLYRGRELRWFQYFTATEWPGGLYASPSFAGSRPGGLVAACWAAMVATGESGYLEAARRVLETARSIRNGIERTPGLRVLGAPLFILAFTSTELDIYRVMDRMSARGWTLVGLQRPPAAHLCVTLRHTQPGVADRFLADLAASTEEVRRAPTSIAGDAPLYGMAARFPLRGMVGELLKRYLDMLYEP